MTPMPIVSQQTILLLRSTTVPARCSDLSAAMPAGSSLSAPGSPGLYLAWLGLARLELACRHRLASSAPAPPFELMRGWGKSKVALLET